MISTTLKLGPESWPIELTLTNRDEMGFRMLLGRRAMHRRLMIDPARSFLADKEVAVPIAAAAPATPPATVGALSEDKGPRRPARSGHPTNDEEE